MDKIVEVLTRGVEQIYPSLEEFEKLLRSAKKIRVYHGIDPTGSQLHLGHMVSLRKLKQLQDLGHEVILLIGDFTGMIGDPSGKSEARKIMQRNDLLENARSYQEQASKILRFEGENPVILKYNSEWLDKLNIGEIIHLASLVTYAQVIERDMFQQRIKEGKDLFVNELLYPLMQGYDSVALDVELEVGGSDQTFNMLMGRTLMKKIKGKEKFVLTTKLLAEPGKEKMGKTTGNLIALNENPNEMFGMIMAWPDEMITLGFELLTDVDLKEIDLTTNPMESKKKLAMEIISTLHTLEKAKSAQEEFERVFQRRETPSEDFQTFQTNGQEINIIDLLVNSGLVPSRAEAKRLVEQGGVDIDQSTINSQQSTIIPTDGMIIKVGKKKFIKIRVT